MTIGVGSLLCNLSVAGGICFGCMRAADILPSIAILEGMGP